MKNNNKKKLETLKDVELIKERTERYRFWTTIVAVVSHVIRLLV